MRTNRGQSFRRGDLGGLSWGSVVSSGNYSASSGHLGVSLGFEAAFLLNENLKNAVENLKMQSKI